MFQTVFVTLFTRVGIPLIAILVLWDQFGSPQATFGVINIMLTISAVIAVIWNLIKLIPNLALLKQKKITKIIFQIFVDVVSVIGFWGAYIITFYR